MSRSASPGISSVIESAMIRTVPRVVKSVKSLTRSAKKFSSWSRSLYDGADGHSFGEYGREATGDYGVADLKHGVSWKLFEYGFLRICPVPHE